MNNFQKRILVICLLSLLCLAGFACKQQENGGTYTVSFVVDGEIYHRGDFDWNAPPFSPKIPGNRDTDLRAGTTGTPW